MESMMIAKTFRYTRLDSSPSYRLEGSILYPVCLGRMSGRDVIVAYADRQVEINRITLIIFFYANSNS